MENNTNKTSNAAHQHGPNCGHTALKHEGHTDYLVDGRIECASENGSVDRVIEVSQINPNECRPVNDCERQSHVHGPDCGHEMVPHGDHNDYLVDGVLHFPHAEHCDDHGPVQLVAG